MPIYYEHAAHMMMFLTAAGLEIAKGVDCRAVLRALALALERDQRRLRKLSHFDAATALLADLETSGLVRCDTVRRTRIIKVLGTTLANFLAATGHAAR